MIFFFSHWGPLKFSIFGESGGNCRFCQLAERFGSCDLFAERERELLPRVELGTSSLPRMRSTTELKQQRAKDGTQTRDPQLGRLVLYRLSYFRVASSTAALLCGCGWIRTTEVERQQIYSLPHLATLEHTLISKFTRESQFSIFNFQFALSL